MLEIKVKLEGMALDMDPSILDGKLAYENKNLRFNATDDGQNLTGIINERSTKEVKITSPSVYSDFIDEENILGATIGHAEVLDYLVLFNTKNTEGLPSAGGRRKILKSDSVITCTIYEDVIIVERTSSSNAVTAYCAISNDNSLPSNDNTAGHASIAYLNFVAIYKLSLAAGESKKIFSTRRNGNIVWQASNLITYTCACSIESTDSSIYYTVTNVDSTTTQNVYDNSSTSYTSPDALYFSDEDGLPTLTINKTSNGTCNLYGQESKICTVSAVTTPTWTLPYGTYIKVEPVPNSGYKFDRWQVSGLSKYGYGSSYDGNLVYHMDEDNFNVTITPIFISDTDEPTLDFTLEQLDLYVEVSYPNPANSNYDNPITYTSSNDSIVTVDSNGNFTGHKIGNAIVTATDTTTGITATCSVHVTKLQLILTCTSSSTITNGSALTTDGDCLYEFTSDGVSDGAEITYKSSDTDAATIDSTGKISFKKEGAVVYITVSASETTKYFSTEIKFLVTNMGSAAGNDEKVYAYLYFNIKIYLPHTPSGEVNIVDSNSVTLDGHTYLVYSSDNYIINNKNGYIYAIVKDAEGNPELDTWGNTRMIKILPTNTLYNNTYIAIQTGSTYSFYDLIIGNSMRPGETILNKVNCQARNDLLSYSSSDISKATVNNTGYVTAIAATGVSNPITITASIPETDYNYADSTSYKLIIYKDELGLSVINKTLYVGNTASCDGYCQSGETITYTVEDESIATIVNGVITGISVGVTTATATAPETDAFEAITKTFTITVKEKYNPDTPSGGDDDDDNDEDDSDDTTNYIDFITILLKDSNNLDNLKVVGLYAGDFNFKLKYPIETLVSIERDDIKKVYWIDGNNCLRMVNLKEGMHKITNSDYFDSSRTIEAPNVTITKQNVGNGVFDTGTIQYAMSYFNKYCAESNICYISPLYYLAEDLGGKPGNRCTASFKIDISNADKFYDYIRLYAITRNLIDTPNVRIVLDIKFKDSNNNVLDITFIDTGINGTTADSSAVLYAGGERIIPLAFALKDDTLFMANYTIPRLELITALKEGIKTENTDSITFELSDNKVVNNFEDSSKTYSYEGLLNKTSSEITTFKCGETYRFGVLFLDKYGNWSSPYWIADKANDLYPYVNLSSETSKNYKTTTLALATTTLSKSVVNIAIENGYVKARPLVVYPNAEEREVLFLGVANCTLNYNIDGTMVLKDGVSLTNTVSTSDLYSGDNLPKIKYLLPSWYYRPLSSTNKTTGTFKKPIVNSVEYLDGYIIPFGIAGGTLHLTDDKDDKYFASLPYLDCNTNKIAELQYCTDNSFSIDWSTITVDSPDITFDEQMVNRDIEKFKVRLVGRIPCSTCGFSFLMDTSTSLETFDSSHDVYPDLWSLGRTFYNGMDFYFQTTIADVISSNDANFKLSTLINYPLWTDCVSTVETGDSGEGIWGTSYAECVGAWYVYPWHRSGSLNNCNFAKYRPKTVADTSLPSVLSKKVFANCRFAPYACYNGDSRFGYNGHDLISDIETAEVFLLSLESSTLTATLSNDVIYRNSFEDEITCTRLDPTSSAKTALYALLGRVYHDTQTTNSANVLMMVPDKSGAAMVGNSYIKGATLGNEKYFETDLFAYQFIIGHGSDPFKQIYNNTEDFVCGNDSSKEITLCYGATDYDSIHCFGGMTYDSSNANTYLSINPIIIGMRTGSNCMIELSGDNNLYNMFNKAYNSGSNYGYPIVEVYREMPNKFGGTSEAALLTNKWNIAGETVSLTKNTNATLTYVEGDTYYQRFDSLKTLPYSKDATNGIIEILSFMCETRVNIDGRYDERGVKDNALYSDSYEETFNLMNTSYTLTNNYYLYSMLDEDSLMVDNYPNLVVWTLSKGAASNTDLWLNSNLTSFLNLDGDKGSINSLKFFSDDIYIFQDSGISILDFNRSTLISPLNGNPILIANSEKVNGSTYIFTNSGCTNKWAITETEDTLAYIDSFNKTINLLKGKDKQELSLTGGFYSWYHSNINTIDSWNTLFLNNVYMLLYDKSTKDLFTINKYDCLAFNIALSKFTSFYSYEKTPWMILFEDSEYYIKNSLSITDNTSSLWRPRLGTGYNYFFTKFLSYYTTFVATEPKYFSTNKCFNEIEILGNIYDTHSILHDLINENTEDTYYSADILPFNLITATTSYQNSEEVTFVYKKDRASSKSNLKTKFRTWRGIIPRDCIHKRDRMQDHYITLTLKHNHIDSVKNLIHEMNVLYT